MSACNRKKLFRMGEFLALYPLFTPELPDLTASESSREFTALNCFPCAPVDHSYTCSAEQR